MRVRSNLILKFLAKMIALTMGTVLTANASAVWASADPPVLKVSHTHNTSPIAGSSKTLSYVAFVL